MGVTDSAVTTRVIRVTLTMRLLLSLSLVAGARPQAHQIRSDWITHNNEFTMAFVNVTYHDPASSELYYHSGEIGKYSSGLVAVASGRLLHVHTQNGTVHDGCDWPWETVAPSDEPWIALVRHDDRCSADVKVENAYRANASAVVVYDHQSGRLLKRLHLEGQHRDSIVTVFFRKEQGEDLAALVDKGFEIWMQLTPGQRITYSEEKLNRTSVLFVSMSFILLLVISLAWLLFYYVQRFRYMHAKDRLARHLVSAARKALSRVPLRTLKLDDEQLGEAECCAVCLESYHASECVRMLPCSHQFHMVCVDPWLLKNRSCPMCKMDILKYYGMTVVSAEEGLAQAGSQSEPSSPLPIQVTLPSSGSSAQHADRRQATSSVPHSLLLVGGSPAAGRTDSSVCTAEGSSTCAAIGGSTCLPGARQACAVQMALRCTKLPDGSAAAQTGPSCSSAAAAALSAAVSAASDTASVTSPRHPASLAAERRLSMSDDDSNLTESAGTFQSCHPASCESLASGSPDVSPVACRAEPLPADAVVVHMSDEPDETHT